MQNSILEIIVTCIGFLFVVFIICNIKGKKQLEKFDNDCITQSEYNSLTKTWNTVHNSNNDDYVSKLYSPKLQGLMDRLDNKASKCHDSNKLVNKYSDGDCPNCQYAQNLFKHMDFDKNHNLGFGSMSNYCPNSLNAPGAQICLRNLRAGTIDIRNMTTKQVNQMLNKLETANNRVNEHQQQISNKIDQKLKRDYVDYFLKHHEPYEKATANFRQGTATLDAINKTYVAPEIDNGYYNDINNINNVPIEAGMDSIQPYYGHYQFDIVHLKTIMKEPNSQDVLIKVTNDDINKLLNSKISIDGNGIYIQYNTGEQSGLSYTSILNIPNTKNNSLPAYKLIGTKGEYEMHPDTDNNLYIKINNTTDIQPTQFIQGMTYLITKM